MKQFIVAAALLPLLMALLTQFMTQQLGYTRTVRAEELAYAAAREAEARGAYDEELTQRLVSELARVYGLAPAEISISVAARADAVQGFRYEISIPVKRIVAAGRLFGISDAENKGLKRITGSGVYPPKYEPPKPSEPSEPSESPDTEHPEAPELPQIPEVPETPKAPS